MKKRIRIKVVLAIVAMTIISFVSAEANELEKIGQFYIGQFETNKADWQPAMIDQLLKASAWIPEEAMVRICGYTDKSGPKKRNEVLAQERAETVNGQLVKLRPDINIQSITGNVYNESENIDFRVVKLLVYMPASWKVDNKALAKKLEMEFATLRDGQSINIQEISALKGSVAEVKGKSDSLSTGMKALQKGQLDVKKELKKQLEIAVGRIQTDSRQEVTATKGSFWFFLSAAILVIIIFAFAINMVRKIKGRESQDIVEVKSEIREIPVDVRIIETEDEGLFYQTSVEKRRDGNWYSLFVSEKGRPIYRKDFKEIKKSVNGSIISEKFREQRNKLVGQGKIKMKVKK
ncbi:OmpA family protein [Candidatus Falkowbacteria bacterium]|nr:OmpA family protein [Candidatus Falkowbacteria bacterium]